VMNIGSNIQQLTMHRGFARSGAVRLQGALPHSLSRLSLTDMLRLGRRRENLPPICCAQQAAELPVEVNRRVLQRVRAAGGSRSGCPMAAGAGMAPAALWARDCCAHTDLPRRALPQSLLGTSELTLRQDHSARQHQTLVYCVALLHVFSGDTRRSSRSTGAAMARAAPQICLR